MERDYDVEWSKTYVMTGSISIKAHSKEDAERQVAKMLGDLEGQMQLLDEDSIEATEA